MPCFSLLCQESGYCYLHFFHQLSSQENLLPPDYEDHLLRLLGANPPISYVLSVLYIYTKSLDVQLSFPRLTHYNSYHIYDDCELVSLSFLLSFFCGDVKPIGSISPTLRLQALSSLGITPDKIFGEYTVDQLRDRSSALRTTVDSALTDMISVASTSRALERIDIPIYLDEKDKVNVLESFPEFNINFRPNQATKHDHPVAAAARMLELQLLLKYSHYSPNSISKTHHAEICDVGGAVIPHFTRGRLNVHCCSPILDSRDSSRITTSLVNMGKRNKLSDTQIEFLMTLQTTSIRNRLWCVNKAQDCEVTAPVSIFLHSTYDIHPTTMADIMQKKNSIVGYGSFIFSGDMYVQSKGHIKELSCHWSVVNEKGKRLIRFFFNNDSSWGYQHDYETYISLARSNHIITTDKRSVYMVEFISRRMGLQFFKISKNLFSLMPDTHLLRPIHYPNASKKSVVVFYSWDMKVPVTTPYFSMKKYTFVADTELVDNMRSYALRAGDSKFTPTDIFSIGCSYARKTIVNGTAVQGVPFEDRINSLDLFRLAHAIFIQVYVEKYNNGLVSKTILEEIRKIRNVQQAGIINGIWEGAKQVFSIVYDFIRKSIYDYLFFWMSMPELFPVSIEDAVTFVTIDDYIAAHQYESATSGALGALSEQTIAFDCDLTALTGVNKKKVSDAVSNVVGELFPSAEKFENATEEVPVEFLAQRKCTQCDKKFVVNPSAVTDGNCMFDSLRLATSLPDTIKQIKIRLLNSRFLETVIDKPEVVKVLQAEREWGNSSVLRIFSLEYHVTICVHTDDPQVYYIFSSPNSDRHVHLMFSQEHYEPMILDLSGGMMRNARQLNKRPPIMKELPKFSIRPSKPFVYNRPAQVLSDTFRFDPSPQYVQSLSHPDQSPSLMPPCRIPGDPLRVKPERIRLDQEVVDLIRSMMRNIPVDRRTAPREPVYHNEYLEEEFQDLIRQNLPSISVLQSFVQKTRVKRKNHHIDFSKGFSIIERDIRVSYHSRFNYLPRTLIAIYRSSEVLSRDIPWVKYTKRVKEHFYEYAGSFLRYPEILNRSEAKLVEIFKTHPALQYRLGGSVVDFCGAPGGFINYLSHFSKSVISYSLVNSIKYDKRVESANVKLCYDDIMSPDFPARLPSVRVNLVTADGAMDSAGDAVQSSLVLREIDLALRVLLKGGAFVIKIFDVDSEVYKKLVYLRSQFSTVLVYKPLLSPAISGESYLICIDFGGTDTSNIQLLHAQIRNVASARQRRLTLLRDFFKNKYIPAFTLSIADQDEHFQWLGYDPPAQSYLTDRSITCDHSVISDDDDGSNSDDEQFDPLEVVTPIVFDLIDNLPLNSDEKSDDLFLPKTLDEDDQQTRDESDVSSGEIVGRSVVEEVVERSEQDVRKKKKIMPVIKKLFSKQKPAPVKGSTSEDQKGFPCFERSVVPTGADVAVVMCHNQSFSPAGFAIAHAGFINTIAVDVGPADFYHDLATAKAHARLEKGYFFQSAGKKFRTVFILVVDKLNSYTRLRTFLSDVKPYLQGKPTLTVFLESIWMGNVTAQQLQQLHTLPRFYNLEFIYCDSLISTKATSLSDSPPEPALTIRRALAEFKPYWVLPESEKVLFRRFNPKYYFGSDKLSHVRNTVEERREMARVCEAIYHHKLEQIFNVLSIKYLTNPVPNSVVTSLKAYDVSIGVYDLQFKRYVIKPQHPKQKYNCVFDGEQFLKFTDATLLTSNSRFVLVSDYTELMLDTKFYKSIRDLDISSVSIPPLKLIQGVPGCGKTTYIINNVKDGDLVLTSTREASEDLRKRLLGVYPKFDVKNVRTVDSYIMNCRSQYATVWIDEALMRHAGDIVLVAHYTRAVKISLLGDVAQIPYICRVPEVEPRYHIVADLLDNSNREILNISHRIPVDVAARISKFYPNGGCKSTNSITSSVAFQSILNLEDVPKNDSVKYLVFKQSEKETLIKNGYKVSTVHEYQGNSAPIIHVVRLSHKPQEQVYLSSAHALVALTRHTKSFKYFSPINTDALSKMITNTPSIAELKAASALKGGFCEPSSIPDSAILVPRGVASCETTPNVIDLQVNTNETNVYPARIRHILPPMHMPLQVLRKALQPKISNPAVVLQQWYDDALPGASSMDNDHDQLRVETSDIALQLQDIALVSSKINAYRAPFDKLRPTLRTAIYPLRQESQTETLLAMVKRNLGTPQLQGLIDEEQASNDMITNFVNTYVPFEKRDIFHNLANEPILPNTSDIEAWLKLQPTTTRQQIQDHLPLWENELNAYTFMIKRSSKPVLEPANLHNYPSLQTIVYSEKFVNAVFCPMFKEIKSRLISLLDDRFKMFADVSPADFAKTLSKTFKPRDLLGTFHNELDISKYDKSQGKLLFIFENKLLKMLGMPDFWADLWLQVHTHTVLRDRRNGVRLKIDYQRKSGDASTFIGNTIILMGVICTAYDLCNVLLALFSGDDSLLISKSDLSRDRSHIFSTLFNLETKVLRYNYFYFCSKFLVPFEDRWFFIPDPLKLVTKLGRKDLANWEHAKEYYTSLKDLLQDYNNANINHVLSEAVNERYPTSRGDLSCVFSAISTITQDFETFKTLFFSNQNDVLCKDPSRARLD